VLRNKITVYIINVCVNLIISICVHYNKLAAAYDDLILGQKEVKFCKEISLFCDLNSIQKYRSKTN
jgi:hypothetical protein